MATIRRVETLQDLEELFEQSRQAPVWVLKHSLICGVSSEALREYRRFVEGQGDEGVYALIEIQRARRVSKALAARTGVRHQSPQVLLLEGGRAVWHTSHWDIQRAALAGAATREVEREAG